MSQLIVFDKDLRKTVIGGIELMPSFRIAKVANKKLYLEMKCEKIKIFK